MLCGSLDGGGVWRGIEYMRMYGCVPCGSPETITMLLIGYLPIQNKKFKN